MKICGLTRLEDVLLARALGAWALGFVFAPSPRRLTPAEARGLIDLAAAARPSAEAPRGSAKAAAPLTVGVFGDVAAAEVARVVEQVGLDAVQLHGQTGPAAAEVREALSGWVCPLALGGASGGARVVEGAPGVSGPIRSAGGSPAPAPPAMPLLIIRAVPMAPEGADPGAVRRAIAAAGAEVDLVLLDTGTMGRFGGTGTTFPWRSAREAGGCGPFLVAGGIGPQNVQAALEESAAWGVDVSSGVESSPGSKDARLTGRLLARVAAMRNATFGVTSLDERQEGPRT